MFDVYEGSAEGGGDGDGGGVFVGGVGGVGGRQEKNHQNK